jgi:hypothetical protein
MCDPIKLEKSVTSTNREHAAAPAPTTPGKPAEDASRQQKNADDSASTQGGTRNLEGKPVKGTVPPGPK